MNKDYCPKCKILTNHTSLHKTTLSEKNPDEDQWSMDYEIISCNGCDNIQFRTIYADENMYGWDYYNREQYYYDDKKYYPGNLVSHQTLKNEFSIPARIRIVYLEALKAMINGCYILSGVGLRATIEAVCVEENIKGRDLKVKINNLEKSKFITEKDASRLHGIRFLGNDSVHEMEVPNEKKLRIALDIVENLIKNLYLIDIEANEHLDTIISAYSEFKSLLIKKSVSLLKNDEKSIKEILGRSFRRIEPTYVANFTQELIDEINTGSIGTISIGSVKNSSIENEDVQHFVKM